MMRTLGRVLTVIGLSAVTQAWADDAPTATKDARPVQKVVLVDNDINDQDLKQILSRGYKPEGKGDQVKYCRSETQVGTRFAKKTCRTSAQILEDERRGKDATAGFQKDLGSPTGK
jgi:hypothetical protein